MTPSEREEDEERAGREKRELHHPLGAPVVGEAPGERADRDADGTVERDHRGGASRRKAEVPRQVEDEERQEHRPQPVHERDREQDPDPAREAAEAAPGVAHSDDARRGARQPVHHRPAEAAAGNREDEELGSLSPRPERREDVARDLFDRVAQRHDARGGEERSEPARAEDEGLGARVGVGEEGRFSAKEDERAGRRVMDVLRAGTSGRPGAKDRRASRRPARPPLARARFPVRRNSFRSSSVIAPCRRIRGGSKRDDRRLEAVRASGRRRGRRGRESPATTCAAVVGLGRPERFALGAATGTPARRIRSRATPSGIRTATVSRPAVTREGTRDFFERTRVRGPGQKRAMSFVAGAGTFRATFRSIVRSLTWTITGLSCGPSLRREDLRDRLLVERVRPEAVDRLRREGDELAAPEPRRRGAEGAGIHRMDVRRAAHPRILASADQRIASIGERREARMAG